MRFLIDADLPRRIAGILRDQGHEAIDVRDVGLGGADDATIAAYAHRNGLCLLTGDFGFADIRNYPPDQYHGIVVIGVPRFADAASITAQVTDLLTARDILPRVRGRLAIVEAGRIRLRPR